MINNALFTEVTEFVSELALLLESEISCVEALELLQQTQENSVTRSLIQQIHKDVQKGQSLADSLSQHPKYVEPFLIDIIRKGEQEKRLAETLTDIANYREKLNSSADNLTARLLFAFLYPSILVFVLILFLFFMSIFIIPVFTDLFTSFGGELPALTAQVIHFSAFIVTYWWLVIAILLVLIGLAIYAYRKNTFFNQLPFFRLIFRKAALIRFLHTYAFALTQRLSPSNGLMACAQMADNKVYANLFEKMRAEIEAGILLTEVFLKQSFFPARVKHIVAVSLKAKQADKLFSKLADRYTRELYRSMQPALKIFSIILTLIVGCIIALFVIAMYLPMLKSCEVI